MASKYEKMDVMLSDIINMPDVKTKIDELKEKMNSMKPNGKNKEEYKKSLIEINDEKKKISKKINFYENYEKNKDKINNIRDFQFELQDKLTSLKGVKEFSTKISTIDKELQNMDVQLEKAQKFIKLVDEKLKDNNLNDEERNDLTDKKEKTKKMINDQNVSYQFKLKQKIEFENENSKLKEEYKDIDKEIANTENLISKCNVIWSSLLKGKNWDEIQVVLEKANFTAGKGTTTKIKRLSEYQKENSEKSKQKSEEQEENIENSENPKIENKEQEESNLPIPVPTFKEKHPILSKIPGLNKLFEKRYEKQKVLKNEEVIEPAKIAEKTSKISKKDWEKIKIEMDKNENETLKKITENGYNEFRKSLSVSVEDQIKENKRKAAEREANKFKSSTYKRQQDFVNEQTKDDDEIDL